jgi:hypothetical protein
MLTPETLRELRTSWLPNITDAGLDRVIELLEKASPLLIHGSFSRAFPMGCLATHVAWNHPATSSMVIDAGVHWLSKVARLNPVSSQVIREWDQAFDCSWEIRQDLLNEFKDYRAARKCQAELKPSRICQEQLQPR